MGKRRKSTVNGSHKPDTSAVEQFQRWEAGLITQTAVAEQDGVTVGAVCQRFQRVAKWLRSQSVESITEIRQSHTRRLMAVYREAMQAWQKSLEDAAEVSVDEGGNGEQARVRKKRKGQSGNAALLQQARGALEDIRKIWGVDEVVADEQESRGRPILTVIVASKEQADGIYQASQLVLDHKEAEQADDIRSD